MIGLSSADKLAVAGGLMGLVAMIIWMNVLWPGPSWHYLMVGHARRSSRYAVENTLRDGGLRGRGLKAYVLARNAAQWWWFLLAPAGLVLGLLARRAGNRQSGEVVMYMGAVACAMAIPGIIKVVMSPWFPLGSWRP